MSDSERLMTVTEVAERLNCSDSLVYALLASGELGCYRIGLRKQGGVRVSEEHLLAYLKNREQVGVSHGQPLKHIQLE